MNPYCRNTNGEAADQSAGSVLQQETAPLLELPQHAAQQSHITELPSLHRGFEAEGNICAEAQPSVNALTKLRGNSYPA